MRHIISIIAIACLLTAAACAPEEMTEVSCPRPANAEQVLKSAQLFLSSADADPTGVYLINITPDSFWACAGFQEGDLLTQFNSRPVSEGPDILELVELITQDPPLELSVQDPSENRRHIAVR
jgi:S1-C subfamily serine protease